MQFLRGVDLRSLGERRKKPRPVVPHPTDASLALVELTKGYFAVISAVDSAEAGRFFWHAYVGENGSVYARRGIPRDGYMETEFLHRFIGDLMGLRLDQQVDHRNRQTLDCRRSNLRDASQAQNLANISRNRRNTSGVKGVSWYPKYEKWVARICADGRRFLVGYFESITEASAAIAAARDRLHGEFAHHEDILQ